MSHVEKYPWKERIEMIVIPIFFGCIYDKSGHYLRIWGQVTFKGTLGEFNNLWQHCKNYNMSIHILPSPDHPYSLA